MSHKIRVLAAAVTASAAMTAAPSVASAQSYVGTSVTPLAPIGWNVCAWAGPWKACASVTKVNGAWVVKANAAGSNVGANAGATAGPLGAAAQAAANAGAKAVAAAASI